MIHSSENFEENEFEWFLSKICSEIQVFPRLWETVSISALQTLVKRQQKWSYFWKEQPILPIVRIFIASFLLSLHQRL